jgi:hypothetical protein
MAVTDGNVRRVLAYRRCRRWRGSQILEGLEGHFLRLLETMLLDPWVNRGCYHEH